MKALSSAVSVAVHAVVGAAVFFGTTRTVRSDRPRPREVPVVLPSKGLSNHGHATSGPLVPPITVTPPDVQSVPGPTTIVAGAPATPVFSPAFSPTSGSGIGATGPWSGGTEENADVLTAPLPIYPDLLRQAGVEGRVVLEATVDTTGRVLAASILVVAATNSGFIAPARQALGATLFRPARVGGYAVRMRVRIPYEFALRTGTRHAR